MKEEKKVNTLGTCRWIRLSLMQISLLTYTQTHLHLSNVTTSDSTQGQMWAKQQLGLFSSHRSPESCTTLSTTLREITFGKQALCHLPWLVL